MRLVRASAPWIVPLWRRLGGPISNNQARAMVVLGLVPRICDVDIEGVKLRCHIGDNSSEIDIALRDGASNKEELSRFLPLLQPGDVVADIGANCGLYAILAARRVAPSGMVLAFEPNPLLVDRLRFNITSNSIDVVRVMPFALGREDGRVQMYIKKRQMGMSGMTPAKKRTPLEVPVRSLASVLHEHRIERIHIIKIDVEGYEDRVLVPFLSSIRADHRPRAILIETAWSERWEQDCVQQCLSLGYRLEWSSQMNALLTREV